MSDELVVGPSQFFAILEVSKFISTSASVYPTFYSCVCLKNFPLIQWGAIQTALLAVYDVK